MSWSRAERGLLGLIVLVSLAVGLIMATSVSLAQAGGGPLLAAPSPPAVLTSSISTGAQNVRPRDPLVISATGGTLTEVTAAGPDGPLAGSFSADRTRWTSTALAYGGAYTATAAGTNADGATLAPLQIAFSTLAPGRTLTVEQIRPTSGAVVGIAMPISIYFSRPVADKAAVQRRLAVVPSVPTAGSWHWVGDDQVNWRPKEYWKAGTVVAVYSSLVGVDTGGGVFGAGNTVSTFTIGRDQRAVGDTTTHTVAMYQDGKLVNTLPASFGRPAYPTQFGVHVAFEKHPEKRMRSDTWAGGAQAGEIGFYDVVVTWAVRISANGEFVHVNGATVGQQGRANVSHGCVNLSPANGKMFYDWVQIGDPVDIVGSDRPLTPRDGDIPDWTIPWEQYTGGSALPPVY